MFCITIYLETESIKTVSKQMQPINMIMIDYWDKKLKKGLHVLEADIITIKKKYWFDVSSSKDAFLQDMFQMTTIALVSVVNHYHN